MMYALNATYEGVLPVRDLVTLSLMAATVLCRDICAVQCSCRLQNLVPEAG
jgi:hypothetical protein